jgi:hypothetical protein
MTSDEIAGHMTSMSPKTFAAYVNERMAEGIVPAAKMRELSRDIDKFIGGLLTAANAPATLRTDAMSAFEPEAPAFADSLAELAIRFRAAAGAESLPRRVETLVHERIARRREPSPAVTSRLGLPVDTSDPIIAAFAAFLRTYAQLPPELSAALTALVPATTLNRQPSTPPGKSSLPPAPNNVASTKDVLGDAKTDAESGALFVLGDDTPSEPSAQI